MKSGKSEAQKKRPPKQTKKFSLSLNIAIFFTGFVFFYFFRNHQVTHARAQPVGKLVRQVIEPFNLQPMDTYTQYFQQYTLDVEGPSYVRTYTYFWAAPDIPKNSHEK